jgi:predicted ATPase
VFEEPGRAVVKAELARGGDGLPWANVERFIMLVLELALAQALEAQRSGAGLSFFDRSVVDALNGLEVLGLATPTRFADALRQVRYHGRVFFTPPWGEIYRTDAERRHTFTEAVQEFERLKRFYARARYEVVLLPKVATEARVEFILSALAESPPYRP